MAPGAASAENLTVRVEVSARCAGEGWAREAPLEEVLELRSDESGVSVGSRILTLPLGRATVWRSLAELSGPAPHMLIAAGVCLTLLAVGVGLGAARY